MEPNIVILAGGISSRMKKSVSASEKIDTALLRDAQEKSKAMIGVGERHRPFLDYLLYNIRESGYRDVVIVVGERDHTLREYYGKADRNNSFHGLTISYAIQTIPEGRTKPLGTVDAVQQALLLRTDWRGKKFTVCNSDNLYTQRALTLLLRTSHKGAMIDYDRRALLFDQARIEQFSVTKKNADGFLTNIIEKPSPEEIARATDSNGRIGISMNIFRLSYDIILPVLGRVPFHPVRQEKELPIAVAMMAAEDTTSMMTIPLSEHVPDLTHPGDIVPVQEFLKREFADFSWDKA
jgi:glucose-1-phosphate adenylyltransferase